MNVNVKNLASPDETHVVGRSRSEVVRIGDCVVARSVLEPGWRWSEDIRPSVGGDTCAEEHRGYILSGSLGARLMDGREIVARAGDSVYIPAGHDGYTVGDEPCVLIEWTDAG